MLNCIDNSGAAIVECVQVIKMKRHAKIGTYITFSIEPKSTRYTYTDIQAIVSL